MQTVKGTVKISEFTSLSDPEDYSFEVTAEGTGAAQTNLIAAVKGLQDSIARVLQQYAQELAES